MSISIHIHNNTLNPAFLNPGQGERCAPQGKEQAGQSLDDLLIKTDKGGALLNPEKKELLEKVAAYMDKHPEIFGKPHGRDTWLSELKEDNFLSGPEAKKFSGAIDMIKDATGGGEKTGAQSEYSPATQGNQGTGKQNFDNALIPSGNGESYLNPSKKGELENIAKFMDQHPEIFGKPHGAESWLSELKENNHLNKEETAGFNKAIDLLKDAQGAFGGNESEGIPQAQSAPQSFGTPQGYGAPADTQGQKGLDLKNTLVETGKGDAYLNPSKKAELESVAKYMDQHPEVFGKPDGKDSWLSELKEDNYLDKNETKGFKKAIDMMQDAQAAGGSRSPGDAVQPQSYGTPQTAEIPGAKSTEKSLNLDDILVQTGKGDAYFNPSKKAEMEGVAKYMDQHPEVFGKPHGKDSWLSELKEDNYLSRNENKAFSAAIDMMKDARNA